MRTYRWFSGLVLFCILTMLLPACNTPLTVFTVDPTHSYAFEGWGTSLSWWAEAVEKWPNPSKRAALEDALFNPDTGLGLNIVRFNFGANADTNHCSRPFGLFHNIDSYERANGTWDWSKDPAQLTVLKDAKVRGANIFEGFANSAPAWMLQNNCTQGNGNANNLLPQYEQAYANYLATISQHFRNDPAFGNITFRTLEPFNEPDLSWATNQEGMAVDLSQQKRVIQDLHTALQQDGASSYTSISAPDDNSIDNAVTASTSYDATTLADLSQLNTHSYHGSQLDAFYQAGQQAKKRIWMSEYTTDGTSYLDQRIPVIDRGPCAFTDKGSTKDMTGPLALSCRIRLDMRSMHPQAWIYWQAVESNNAYGLLQTPFDPKDQNYQTFAYTKQYYAMAQYSKFIRPGYQIIDSSDQNAVVAYDPSSHNLIIVVTNTDPNAAKPVSYDLSKFNTTYHSALRYVTSASQNMQQQSSLPILNKQVISTVPPNSITTYVITNASVVPSVITVPMPPTQTTCPSPGTARTAVMRPLALGTDQNIVYVKRTGNTSDPASATIYRYNTKTGKTTQLVHIENATILTTLAEISSDGQWVIFDSEVNGSPAIQMVRMDGQGLQTLYCLPPTGYTYPNVLRQILLSPDQKQLAFVTSLEEEQPTFSLLNMATGTLQTALQSQGQFSFYEPVMWVNNTQLYLWRYPIAQSALFLLNTQNGSNQPVSTLTQITNFLTTFDVSPDHTQLFTGVCQVCGQGIFIGPSTISAQPATSPAQKVIYTTTGAIESLVAAPHDTLLFAISSFSLTPSRPADTSHDGIWKMHTDGSGLTRLSTQASLAIENYQDISPDGKWYLLLSRAGLLYAPLDGEGTPIQFTPVTSDTNITFTTVGWTMM